MRQKHHAGPPIERRSNSHLPPDRLSLSPAGQQEDPNGSEYLIGTCVLYPSVAAAFFSVARAPPGRRQASTALWTILIVTEPASATVPTATLSRSITGRLVYDGAAGVELNRQVDQSGRVAATVQRGEQGGDRHRSPLGRPWPRNLARQTSASQCSGYWEAERRLIASAAFAELQLRRS